MQRLRIHFTATGYRSAEMGGRRPPSNATDGAHESTVFGAGDWGSCRIRAEQAARLSYVGWRYCASIAAPIATRRPPPRKCRRRSLNRLSGRRLLSRHVRRLRRQGRVSVGLFMSRLLEGHGDLPVACHQSGRALLRWTEAKATDPHSCALPPLGGSRPKPQVAGVTQRPPGRAPRWSRPRRPSPSWSSIRSASISSPVPARQLLAESSAVASAALASALISSAAALSTAF